tara:strand:- start:409 stop:1086 length:678 start_codon:yes stop_codon:yes gene_type:complete
MEQYIIKNVEALWPKINTTYHFDSNEGRSVTCDPTAPNAEYSIQFRMDNDTAKALFTAMTQSYQANKKEKWADKLERKFVKDDDGMFTHKANLKGAYKNKVTQKPLQFDAKGNRLPDDFLLTTGSTVNVAVQFYPYDMGGKQNVSLRLRAVQVIKYVPIEERNPFEATDGYVFNETEDNPFDEPLVVIEDKEEPVPEPKKVVKKPSPPTKDADDDLSSIVDDWDD